MLKQQTHALSRCAQKSMEEIKPPRKIRLCVIATIGKSIQILYAGRLEYFMANGFEITVVCAPSELDEAIRARGVRLKTFPLTRAVTPWTDLRALVQLYRFLRKEAFDIVEVSTPKAALLGSLATRMTGSGRIVHVLRGLAYEGKSGMQGFLLRASTRIPCKLADFTLAVSHSARDQAVKDGMAVPERIRVLGSGSGNGLDLSRFSPEKRSAGLATRKDHHIEPGAVVFGFVGRMTHDKGLEELTKAFDAVYQESPQTVLLIVGEYEQRDRPSDETVAEISDHPGIRHVGWQADVNPFMAAMDVVVAPTYREGFANVLLEAAGLGLPVITTDATGARDALIDGVTGLSVPVGDVVALKNAMARLVRDSSLREAMGRAGNEWVRRHFDQKEVWRRYVDAFRELVIADVACPVV